jgi:hypothetical protein
MAARYITNAHQFYHRFLKPRFWAPHRHSRPTVALVKHIDTAQFNTYSWDVHTRPFPKRPVQYEYFRVILSPNMRVEGM